MYRVTTTLLVVAVLLVGATYYQLQRMERIIYERLNLPMNPPFGGIQITEEIPCGSSTVTVTTICGQDYEGNPIPGETFQECHDRHEAKVTEVERVCSGD